MNYTLHQLRVFLKVVENQSITKASEELNLTQPAVSIQLKKFQDQFSIPLTEVVSRKLYVTDFGREIAKAAENILIQVDAINYKTMSFKNQLSGRIKISVASTGKYVMPYFLSDFFQLHKAVDLIMDVTNKTQVVKSLEENAVDFSLVSVVPEQIKTRRLELLENKLYLVGSRRLREERPSQIRKIFEQYPLLFREPGSATRAAMEGFLDKHKLPTYKKIELTSNEALKQAVLAGLGYSVMPIIGLKNALRNGDIEIIPFKHLPIITQWNLVWHESKMLSPAAEALLNYIQEHKQRIVDEHFKWHHTY